MKTKFELTATQLKIIAILAMVCDHTAWGFVEMFSVQGQIMHVIGRLTIPIMSFFIAEGYRKTSDLKKYILRMSGFALITIVPFYLFFGEEYGYRQNIIFDFLLALLTLTVVDSKKLNKPLKALLTVLLVIISAFIGGWPILPICYVLIFFYGKTFKQKATWFVGITLFLEVFIIGGILLDNVFHYLSYDWVWYQWLYFLGFILALPLLYLYNGEKGNYPFGKYFFYCFYPCHFLVLFTIQRLLPGHEFYFYFAVNLACLVVILALIFRLVNMRPSRALNVFIVLAMSGLIYVFGFTLEIFTHVVDIAYAGVIMQYFGECFVFLCFLAFMSELCKKKLPKGVYIIAAILSVIIMTSLMTTRQTHLFYTNIAVDYSGPFPRMNYEYGPVFYLFFLYMILGCGGALIIGAITSAKSHGIEKKRIRLVMLAVICPWVTFIIRGLGFSGGYEITPIGVLGSLILIRYALISYGYFDSVQLAGENALHHFGEGVLVVDSTYKVLYKNKKMDKLFPDLSEKDLVSHNAVIMELLEGKKRSFIVNDSIYDVEIDSLEEHGYVQGYLICTKDMTEHYKHLEETKRFANMDSLTGISNRAHFKSCCNEFRMKGGTGTMLMFDLDNFKGVNDTFGHSAGDKVLITMAETLSGASDGKHIVGRLGGDEFCMFLKLVSEPTEIGEICEFLISDFAKRLEETGFGGLTSISIGAAILDTQAKEADEDDFKSVYKQADAALYEAKNAGKGTYRIYHERKEK